MKKKLWMQWILFLNPISPSGLYKAVTSTTSTYTAAWRIIQSRLKTLTQLRRTAKLSNTNKNTMGREESFHRHLSIGVQWRFQWILRISSHGGQTGTEKIVSLIEWMCRFDPNKFFHSANYSRHVFLAPFFLLTLSDSNQKLFLCVGGQWWLHVYVSNHHEGPLQNYEDICSNKNISVQYSATKRVEKIKVTHNNSYNCSI